MRLLKLLEGRIKHLFLVCLVRAILEGLLSYRGQTLVEEVAVFPYILLGKLLVRIICLRCANLDVLADLI